MPLQRLSIAGETTHQTLARIPRPTSPDELWLYVRIVTGVRIPRKAVCATHQAPFDAFATAYFARMVVDGEFVTTTDADAHHVSMAIWKASRGFGGKSQLLALLTHIEAIALAADTAVLGGSGEQSKRVTSYLGTFWAYESSPDGLLVGTAGGLRTKLANGGATLCLMASQASVRGSHQPRLRMDEIDVMKQAILDSALGQTMRQGGLEAQTVLSSTHQNAQGTMSTMLERAHQRGWPVFEWCFRESMGTNDFEWRRNERGRWKIHLRKEAKCTEWLKPDEVERKRNEVTDAMWLTEYELQEPSPEGRAINPDAVERMFNPRFGIYAPRDGEDLILERPVPGARYATGADWAKTRDWTIIVTYRVDVRPWRVVAYLKIGRKRWPDMVARLNERIKLYPGTVAHDATGIGTVVGDYIDAEGSTLIDFTMVGQQRADMLSEYISYVEHDGIDCPRIEWAYGEHKFGTYAQVFKPDSANHTPDSIVAFALAKHAASYDSGEWPVDEELERRLESLDDAEREDFGRPLFDTRARL